MKICRVCNSKEIRDSFTLNNFPSSAQGWTKNEIEAKVLKEDINVFECKECGLVQITNQPVKYYKEVIRSSAYSEDMKFQRLKQFSALKDLYITENKIFALEIGTGAGEYLNICKELNWESFGIEWSKENIKKAIGKEKIINGFVGESNTEDLKLKLFNLVDKEKINFCFCLNFIEHWPNPIKSLMEIKKLISKEAICLFEVPNFNMIKEENLYSEFIPDHLSYFTINSFSYLINKAGYEIIKIENFYNDYIISCYCKPKNESDLKNLNIKYMSEKEMISKSINKLKGNIFFWGAGHQALAYLSMIGTNKNIKVIDSAKFKQGNFCPGSGYRIHEPKILEEVNSGDLIISCGGYNKEVLKIAKQIINGNFNFYYIINGELKRIQ
ncbi:MULTISPECIES: methyltransferase domain-containing protein [Prochlorococcus]|uniref:Putative methyltransferase n=1 Tax=Prochlorococcus marinus str. MIT 9116 TaxID=167544 RepID=A0A0A1ZU49_PROMR|nr:methyltransferase domain-containing protein [Prochlorococcus marinus]KGF91727.1 putative methyltransferase [Prochlorococcus marinus str. MIT 9107]KGF93087.1 putative methyltransferase [Prochlorococcus marinus str. MIT 9116]KGF95092.1 putative methyltransferase [Prochlorococcus marinus str. MIT 9123]